MNVHKKILIFLFITFSSINLFAYSYAAAGKEPTIDSRELILKHVNSGDFAKAKKEFVKAEKNYTYLSGIHNKDLSLSLQKAINDKNASDINRWLNVSIAAEINRRLDGGLKNIETFNISFLPDYFEQIALINDIDKSQIKYLFSIYFLFFVLSFFPATQIVKRYGTKSTYVLSTIFIGLGAILLFSSQNYYVLMIARAFSGMSLGFVLISTENHLMHSLPIEKRQLVSATTGVLYSSAIISGAILGSLISTYLDVKFIFLWEFILAVFVGMYILIFIVNQHISKIEIEKKYFNFERKV